MRYEPPQLTEIKMDAEIGSYQNDFEPLPLESGLVDRAFQAPISDAEREARDAESRPL